MGETGAKMPRTWLRTEKEHADFLGRFQTYGFQDEREMLEAAIGCFRRELEREALKKSADRHAEVSSENDELKELTESALADWPE